MMAGAKRFLVGPIAFGLGLVAFDFHAVRPVSAQSYPSRPITMIVPFAAGGSTDLVARVTAERMKVALGQPIIVENVVGAGGVTGTTRALRAAPDGHTVHIGIWGSHVIAGALYPLPYDPVKDIEPISLLVSQPFVLFARKDLPAANVKELITWLKVNSDKASQGASSAGMQAMGALFQKVTSTKFQFVPYRGGPPALQDLAAGHIDLVWDSTTHLPQVRSGVIKAYLVTTKDRLATDPDIPTPDELELGALSVTGWVALFAPKGTPRDIIEKLNRAASESLDDPTVQKRFTDIAFGIVPHEQRAPEFLRTLVRTEIGRWWPIVKAANIRAE